MSGMENHPWTPSRVTWLSYTLKRPRGVGWWKTESQRQKWRPPRRLCSVSAKSGGHRSGERPSLWAGFRGRADRTSRWTGCAVWDTELTTMPRFWVPKAGVAMCWNEDFGEDQASGWKVRDTLNVRYLSDTQQSCRGGSVYQGPRVQTEIWTGGTNLGIFSIYTSLKWGRLRAHRQW